MNLRPDLAEEGAGASSFSSSFVGCSFLGALKRFRPEDLLFFEGAAAFSSDGALSSASWWTALALCLSANERVQYNY